ncbi:hypothetical protein WA158_004996 [Blastocystis sp. Blastoise]
MRIWHQYLIKLLPDQWLLGQHREICALRGKGWLKKHPYINFTFEHPIEKLIAFHFFVLEECTKRGFVCDSQWFVKNYRGHQIGIDPNISISLIDQYINQITKLKSPLYDEFTTIYLEKDITDLNKRVPEYWQKHDKNKKEIPLNHTWIKLESDQFKSLYPYMKSEPTKHDHIRSTVSGKGWIPPKKKKKVPTQQKKMKRKRVDDDEEYIP